MNKLLITGCLLATAFAAVAMPTKKELAAAQKLVEDVIAPDVKALNAGRKTVKDVADIQMKLASDAQSEAEKYLLLQSAFRLYSRGEEFDPAAKALTAITRDIKNVPPELITELVDKEFNRDMGLKAPKEIEAVVRDAVRLAQSELERTQREAERTEQRAQLREIQEKLKRVKGARESVKESSPAVRQAVESILKGMIKVPGRDYWLSATELTQEQWEPIMGYNLSKHKGENLPVEMVSRDDCDVFLEKLNQTKEVRESQFEFGLPTGGEWLYAAQGGSGMADVCWIKPGVVGNVLDMAWVGENSSNQTHVVATKSANAFGFYDMKGNVWEWLFDPARERGVRRGHSFCEDAEKCSLHNWINTPRNRRYGDCGLRLAAHKRVAPRPLLGGLRRHDSVNNEQASSPRARRLQRQQEAQAAMQLQTTIDDYTWSYHVNNGEAEIVASVGGRTCAISPSPTGKVLIPSTLEGVSVRSIGGGAFFGCSGLKEVIIPPSVTSIGIQAFTGCSALTSVTLHECVTNISEMAFQGCSGLFSVTIPPAVKSLASQTFVHCGNLTVVTIPSSVTSIGDLAFCDCGELTSVTMLGERPSAPNNIFQDCGKLKLIHVPANCKSWAGMKEWQGIPLVFDAK